MELGGRLIPEFVKIDYSFIPAPAFRYGYFSVYLISAALGIGSLCCSYCNFAVVPRFFGALFSVASKVSGNNYGTVASNAYGLDLLGAATGALLFTIYLIPLLGFAWSVVVTGIFNLIIGLMIQDKKM